MTSSKESIARLAKILKAKEVKSVVFSPGSRNAPIIISIANDPYFECYNIPDERSAGFFALGIALATKKPVVICCTSGSAAINYGPAIVEAFYQKIPIIAITADRPQEWIDQRAGQTMRQGNLYQNYIKFSTELRQEVANSDDVWFNDRLINQALELAISDGGGPVHINVPLKEPLYNQIKNSEGEPKLISLTKSYPTLCDNQINEFRESFLSHGRVLVICGQHQPDKQWSDAINQLSLIGSVVVLSELTSNVFGDRVISCIDRTINNLQDVDIDDFSPSLLITCGYSLVSKKIRFLLRDMDIAAHWHINPYDEFIDTYKSLTDVIPVSIEYFVDTVLSKVDSEVSHFKRRWHELNQFKKEKHTNYLKDVPWSDLGVVNEVMAAMPDDTHVHMANSTSVRYGQLFDVNPTLSFQCNRGVSGIDGCSSTAVGYSIVHKGLNVLITGDIAFFYDNNALWNSYISSNLRILILNNKGGNIFRVIPGPATTDHLEEHFESHHNTEALGIAAAHDLLYLSADDFDSFQSSLNKFLDYSDSAIVFEVFTPRQMNDQILKEYFEQIRRI